MKKLFLSLLLLLSPLAWADESPRLISYPPERIMGFRGLDTRTPAPNIEDGRAIDVLNVKLSSAFSLKKRYGFSVINSSLDDFSMSSPAITGIFDAEYSNGTSWTFAFIGSKVKYDASGVWRDVPGVATITSGQDNQFKCQVALDLTVCTDSIDPPLVIDSTPQKNPLTFSGLSSPITKAYDFIWYRNYAIWGNTVEGGIAYPTRFRWSNVGTVGTYSDTDYVDIASQSGDQIVGFSELYGDLYIFMRKSIWKASLVGGNDVFTFTKIVDGIGAISRESIRQVNLPGSRFGIIFLTEDRNIYLFNGVVVGDIGVIIQPTLDVLNPARLQYATAVYDGKDYFLSISGGGSATNDTILDYQVEIGEWSKHDQINANAFARVKETTSVIKTYYGNYGGFVYWLDNPDLDNDVDGATGIVDSVAIVNTATQTGAQIIIDSGITAGIYTGAIVRITSGTGAGQERIVLASTSTGLVVTSAFSSTLDTTSNYSVGDINAYYQTKWYDFGDAPRYKAFKSLYFWAKEDTNDQVTVTYYEDYGASVGSEIKSLSPSGNSLWDVALWDEGIWGTTGDKFYSSRLTGRGRVISVKFSESSIDKDFNVYGFHFLADRLDRE